MSDVHAQEPPEWGVTWKEVEDLAAEASRLIGSTDTAAVDAFRERKRALLARIDAEAEQWLT